MASLASLVRPAKPNYAGGLSRTVDRPSSPPAGSEVIPARADGTACAVGARLALRDRMRSATAPGPNVEIAIRSGDASVYEPARTRRRLPRSQRRGLART